MSRWPAIVWDAPPLRGVDARSRGEIEAAGELRALAQGAVLFRPGDPADDLFVVVEGSVELRASSRAIRRAERGDAFGDEATVRMTATRRVEAVALSASRVARVPAVVLRRGVARGGASKMADRIERTNMRDGARDALRASPLGATLEGWQLDALLDATSHVHLARGEALYRVGDPATHVHVVAEGLIQRVSSKGRLHVDRAGVIDANEDEARRGADALAVGPSWVLAITRDAIRAVGARIDRAQSPSSRAAVHDVYRAKEARTLLVIDQNSCVRCGECVAGCASAHDDGLPRLVRRGEKIAVGGALPTLLLVQSCHHCEHPACLGSCPTGAIVRGESGEVTIREALCTGCGACVKACPWDNVQMAPGADGRHPIAAKCDACGDLEGGPACVRSCPTEAIARVDASSVLGGEQGASPPRAARHAWPSTVGAACVAVALAHTPMARMTSGAIAGAAILFATTYAVAKRAPWRRGTRRRASTASTSRVRLPFLSHLALGVVAVGSVVTHAGPHLADGVAGALAVAFWIMTGSGVLAALAFRLIPRRLSRVEREGVLAEDLEVRAGELRALEFTTLSGKSAGTKAIYAKLLAPYARAPLGGAVMALLARSLDDEELRLRERVRGAVGERGSADQTRDLVTLAVDQRALGAQRLLGATLRMWVPIHVVAAAITLGLLALHVAYVLRVHK